MDNALYQHELLDHYRNPRNCGPLESADATASSSNPSCGDAIVVQVRWQEETLTEVRFQGKGCVISQAAASLVTEHCKGKPLTFLMALTKDDVLALLGISLGPTRLRCALLSLEALHEACAASKLYFTKDQKKDSTLC